MSNNVEGLYYLLVPRDVRLLVITSKYGSVQRDHSFLEPSCVLHPNTSTRACPGLYDLFKFKHFIRRVMLMLTVHSMYTHTSYSFEPTFTEVVFMFVFCFNYFYFCICYRDRYAVEHIHVVKKFCARSLTCQLCPAIHESVFAVRRAVILSTVSSTSAISSA